MSVEQGPVSPEVDTVIVHARGILETVEQVFQAAGINLPTRRFINVGGVQDTVWDCEQVVVSVEQLYNGLPGQQGQVPTACHEPWTAVSTVTIVRCLPTPTQSGRSQPQPPSPAAMVADAELRMKDMWLLRSAGSQFADEQNFAGGMGDVTAGPGQGGLRAVTLTLVAAVV